MNNLLSPQESETLWQLAGQSARIGHTAQPRAELERLRPRVQAAMVEIVLRKLEQAEDVMRPEPQQLLVLLSSPHTRLRTLGLRLGAGLRPRG
jgi:hypothetical protein